MSTRSGFKNDAGGQSPCVEGKAPVVERLQERLFRADNDTIRAARRFVREAARTTALDPVRLSDIELAASELVTNAIEHGSGEAYRVRVVIEDDRFVVEVSSKHCGEPISPPSMWGVGRSDELTGRGLGLVKAVSTETWIEQSHDELLVGCAFISLDSVNTSLL